MKYIRPKLKTGPIGKPEKIALLKEYFEHYEQLAKVNPDALNCKVPRSVFAPVLEELGALALTQAAKLAHEPGVVKEFLDQNPLPGKMNELLPAEFRVFSLLLNSFKQWVSSEQAATDKYLLGGNARALLRATSDRCLVSGEPLDRETFELHHVVRDGRPPIPLNKEVHAFIEGQTAGSDDEVKIKIKEVKKTASWILLREGLEFLLAPEGERDSRGVRANAKAFANRSLKATGLDPASLLQWMDENELAVSD